MLARFEILRLLPCARGSILSLMLLAGNAACKRFTSGIAASVACSTPNTVWTGAG